MSALLAAPAVDTVHLIRCCDTTQALCGTTAPDGWGPAGDGDDCRPCRVVLLSATNCGAEYCPGWSQ